MAIAFTFRSSYHDTATATTAATSPAFTPAAHSLMVAVMRTTGQSAAPTSIQTTSATNRYTFAEVYNNGSGTNYFGIWVADSGATPGSDTITYTRAAGGSGNHLVVCEVTGADLSGTALQAIVANATTTTGTSGTATITFAAASDANNRPFAAYAKDQIANPATPRANWDELDEGSYSSPTDLLEIQGRVDAFETTGTATWAGTPTWVTLGIEIKAAAAAASTEEFFPVVVGA